MFKSNGGFTLVELIVVIAILGLLTAIGVPAYSGYVSQAKTKIEAYDETINKEAIAVSEAWEAAFGGAADDDSSTPSESEENPA